MLLMQLLFRLWWLPTLYFFVAAHPSPHHNVTSVENGENPISCVVEQFWNPKLPTPKDWHEHDMNKRLRAWWAEHEKDIKAHGFAAAVGIWALDTPDFDCRLGGSDANCEFQVSCQYRSLNCMSEDDARFAYYLLKSIQNVHAYFNVQAKAIATAASDAAFRKDGFAYHFDHNEQRDLGKLALILGISQALFSLGAAVTPALVPEASAMMAGVWSAGANNLFAGLNNVFLTALETQPQDQGVKAAELGIKMGRTFTEVSKQLVIMNDALMKGETVSDLGDMRKLLESGLWLSYDGFDRIKMIEAFSDRLTAQAINILWRAQKVFIIGGGKCGDGQGVGTGPSDGVWCRESDNTAWYLYHWQDFHGLLSFTDSKYGYIMWPHGMHDLGKGDYARITVKDVIESSVRTYEAQKAAAPPGSMEFKQTAQSELDATIKDIMSGKSVLEEAVRAPFVFTIPVANISKAANGVPTHPPIRLKNKILRPYTTKPKKHQHRAHFCGPIAEGDLSITRHWMDAANMHDFESPIHKCEEIKPYCPINRIPITGDGSSDSTGFVHNPYIEDFCVGGKPPGKDEPGDPDCITDGEGNCFPHAESKLLQELDG
ncbi:hypothetical protein G7Y79_00004g015530 [Physcia stellaris]|nr:hypothetical protein G7Y79_00004g015530 [Physcia stellaris]